MVDGQTEISDTIVKYFLTSIKSDLERERGSHRSLDHCSKFFHTKTTDHDVASLHLGFFLASWGMYRGSAAIRDFDYLIHRPAVELILEPQFDPLRAMGLADFSEKSVGLIFTLAAKLKGYYRPLHINPTDALVTKILLGTLGCVPAYDSILRKGLRNLGLPRTFSERGFKKVIAYCKANDSGLTDAQKRLTEQNVDCTIMRVFDLYCHARERNKST